jgi:hypothetical protein
VARRQRSTVIASLVRVMNVFGIFSENGLHSPVWSAADSCQRRPLCLKIIVMVICAFAVRHFASGGLVRVKSVAREINVVNLRAVTRMMFFFDV